MTGETYWRSLSVGVFFPIDPYGCLRVTPRLGLGPAPASFRANAEITTIYHGSIFSPVMLPKIGGRHSGTYRRITCRETVTHCLTPT